MAPTPSATVLQKHELFKIEFPLRAARIPEKAQIEIRRISFLFNIEGDNRRRPLADHPMRFNNVKLVTDRNGK